MKAKLIVALDVEKLQDAEHFVRILSPTVELFKVGSQLYAACGPEAVAMVGRSGGRVFLDLKFHDIPNTVGNAVSASIKPSVFMMTVHASGGREMMRCAANAAGEKARELNIDRPKVVGATVLTSEAPGDRTKEMVIGMALAAREAGLDGVVCSVREAAAVRQACGKDFVIVTPGIRPAGGAKDDQKRTAAPADAVSAGSDFLVVGRPILEAKDPVLATQAILKQII